MSSASITLLKKNFNIVYSPKTIVSASFQYDNVSSVYKGSELYYYVNFFPITNTPDNGFIRLIFGSFGTLGPNPFCYSNVLQAFVNELGLVCTV